MFLGQYFRWICLCVHNMWPPSWKIDRPQYGEFLDELFRLQLLYLGMKLFVAGVLVI